jgi:hypothetical protein
VAALLGAAPAGLVDEALRKVEETPFAGALVQAEPTS